MCKTLVHLSEFAGLLVTGLNRHTRLKLLNSKYSNPTLKGVNMSKTLQTKFPPAKTLHIINNKLPITNYLFSEQTVHIDTGIKLVALLKFPEYFLDLQLIYPVTKNITN